MAVLPQALQFSETPIKVLLDIAEQNQQQQLLMQKARLEDEKARMALPMEFVNAMDNLDSDVQNQYANAYFNSFVQAVRNKQIPTYELRNYVAKMVMDIKSKSGTIKQWKDGFKESVSGLGNESGIYIDQLKAAGSKYLLEALKDPSKLGELKNPSEWVYSAINDAPELFGNRQAGASVFNEILAKTPKADMTEVIKVDATGNMSLSEKSGGKIPWWYTMKEGVGPTGLKTLTPVLKTDAEGNIIEDVFNSFYSYKDPKNPNDFRMRLWIDGGANDLINKNNLGKAPTDPDYIDPNSDAAKTIAKRRFLTEQLQMRPSYDAPRESSKDKIRSQNITINNAGFGGGGAPDVFEDMKTKVSGGTALNKLPTMYQNFILETANDVKPKPGGLKHTNENTSIKYENNEVNLYDKKGTLIMTIDKTGFNTGVLGQLGQKQGLGGFNIGDNNTPPKKKKKYNPNTGKIE